MLNARKNILTEVPHETYPYDEDGDNNTLAYKDPDEWLNEPADHIGPADHMVPLLSQEAASGGIITAEHNDSTLETHDVNRTILYEDHDSTHWQLPHDYPAAYYTRPANSDTPEESESRYQVSDPMGYEVVEDDTTPYKKQIATTSAELESEEAPYEETDGTFDQQDDFEVIQEADISAAAEGLKKPDFSTDVHESEGYEDLNDYYDAAQEEGENFNVYYYDTAQEGAEDSNAYYYDTAQEGAEASNVYYGDAAQEGAEDSNAYYYDTAQEGAEDSNAYYYDTAQEGAEDSNVYYGDAAQEGAEDSNVYYYDTAQEGAEDSNVYYYDTAQEGAEDSNVYYGDAAQEGAEDSNVYYYDTAQEGAEDSNVYYGDAAQEGAEDSNVYYYDTAQEGAEDSNAYYYDTAQEGAEDSNVYYGDAAQEGAEDSNVYYGDAAQEGAEESYCIGVSEEGAEKCKDTNIGCQNTVQEEPENPDAITAGSSVEKMGEPATIYKRDAIETKCAIDCSHNGAAPDVLVIDDEETSSDDLYLHEFSEKANEIYRDYSCLKEEDTPTTNADPCSEAADSSTDPQYIDCEKRVSDEPILNENRVLLEEELDDCCRDSKAEVEEESEPAQQVSDEKVGCISIYVLDGEHYKAGGSDMDGVEQVESHVCDDIEESHAQELTLEKEWRYVYRGAQKDAKPYYLTRTRNKVLVVDPTKITFFPGGEEPEELQGKIKDYAAIPLEEEIPTDAKAEVEPEREPWKVGTVIVQVPKIHPFTKAVRFRKVKRDVFTFGTVNEDHEPGYFTQTGGRRIGVEERRVRFLLVNGKEPQETEADVLDEESSDEEDIVGPQTDDEWKVGAIVVRTDGVADARCRFGENKTLRDVFSRPEKLNGEPYYLTRTGNAILVLDRSRIHYAPGKRPLTATEKFSFEKEQRKQRRAEKRRRKALAKAEKEKKLLFVKEHGEVVKVGVIYIRLPRGNGGLCTEKKKHDVYCSVLNEEEKPFYFSTIGSKIYISDNTRIRYLLSDGSDPLELEDTPEPTNVATRYLKELLEKEAKDEENEEEEVDLTIVGPGEDLKIGTITVQTALKPGQRVTMAKEILDVYGTPTHGFTGKPKKPYMLTKTGKRIYVENRRAIRYLPAKEQPMRLEKPGC